MVKVGDTLKLKHKSFHDIIEIVNIEIIDISKMYKCKCIFSTHKDLIGYTTYMDYRFLKKTYSKCDINKESLKLLYG